MESSRLARSADLETLIRLGEAARQEARNKRGGDMLARLDSYLDDIPLRMSSALTEKDYAVVVGTVDEIVVGYGWIYGWYAQNLSYHLESRPKWKSKLQQKPNIGSIWIKNFNEIKNCEGVLYQIEPFNDICMLGSK